MRILVLGATGFIGTRVVDDLVLGRGFQARVTVRDYRKAIRLGRLPVEWVDGQGATPAGWPDAARGCDAVICCAHPFSSPNEASDALDMSRAAVAAAAVTSTRRLVFLSSTAVFATAPGDVRDDTVPNPDSAYGRTKLQCETLLCREHDAGTVRVVILRPSIVYGPFSPSWTALPARRLQTGRLILPGDAAGVCNAVYVDDVARAASEAITLEARTPVAINVNGSDPGRWRHFYEHYAAAVRPGAVEEWSLTRIDTALAAERRERGAWPAVKRAISDQAVRDRLNEIPVLARLNRVGKSLGWGGLPPVAALPALGTDASGPSSTLEAHLPDPMLLALYLRAPRIDGSAAARVLGVMPRSLAAGMRPTLQWLEWAGFAAHPSEAALTA